MNFLKNITIGQYASGESFLHKMDPRFKMIILFIMIIQCFLLDKWFLLMTPLLFFMIASLFSGISFRFIMRGLKPVIPFILIAFFCNSFLTPGHPVFMWKMPFEFTFNTNISGPIPEYDFFMIAMTAEGIDFGFFMSLRLIIVVLAASIFTLTTSPTEITDAVEYLLRWGKPIGIPAHEIAMMMSIALRFIPTLTEQLDRIVSAQMSRGADFEAKSLVEKAKCFIPVLIPLFVNAFKTADDLACAMEARCYHGGEGRTRLREMKSSWRDFASITTVILLCVILNYFQFFFKLSA